MSKKKNEATRRPYETPTITKLDPSDPRAVALRAELEPGEPTPTTGLVVVDHLEETEAAAWLRRPLAGELYELRELLVRRERELELVRGQFEAARSFLLESETRSAALRKTCRHVVAELRKGNGAEIGALAEVLRIAIEPPVVTDAEVSE